MSTDVVERGKTQAPLAALRDKLLTRRVELKAALEGSGIEVDRFIRTAVTAATMQPELVSDVSFQSLWVALLKACRDRLLPDGRQGAIIPYKREAVWVPMYRGLIDRFEQSGEYKWITANVHREDDRAWDVWLDEHGQHFLHRPGPGEGRVIETYAAAITKSGAFFITVMNEVEMQRIRNQSRARAEQSPWNQWSDEMRKKSALRRLCKLLPMPQPLEDLIESENEDESAPLAPAAPMLAAPKPAARARGAAQALDQFAGEPEPPPHEPPIDREPIIEPEQQPQDDPALLVRIETAHERGRQARKDGMKRTALPGEYREPGRSREGIAWRTGWEGDDGGGNA